jgi:hypothetical protein
MDLAAAQVLGAILRRAGANTAVLSGLKLGYLEQDGPDTARRPGGTTHKRRSATHFVIPRSNAAPTTPKRRRRRRGLTGELHATTAIVAGQE